MNSSKGENKISEKRIDELTLKYSSDQATDDEIRELFHALGETEVEINFRIDLQRGRIPPDMIV